MSRRRDLEPQPDWVRDPSGPKDGEGVPMYRPVQDRTWQRSDPDELCPDCGKPVREHIAEFKAFGRKIEARILPRMTDGGAA